MDCSINIGLGNGDTNERIQALMQISAKQQETLTQLGVMNPLVTAGQYSSTLRKIVELSGFKDPSQFFNQIPADYQPPQPPAPKPTPEEVLAQVQAQSIQADIQKKAAELELKRQEMVMADDLARDRMNQEMYLKKYELELKYGAQLSTAEIMAAQNVDREAMKQQSAIMQAQMPQPMQQPMQQAPQQMQPPLDLTPGMMQ
jgi:hypothetical protein